MQYLLFYRVYSSHGVNDIYILIYILLMGPRRDLKFPGDFAFNTVFRGLVKLGLDFLCLRGQMAENLVVSRRISKIMIEGNKIYDILLLTTRLPNILPLKHRTSKSNLTYPRSTEVGTIDHPGIRSSYMVN